MSDKTARNRNSYQRLISTIHKTHPLVHHVLFAADVLRTKRLESYREGVLLSGLDALLNFLVAARSSFEKHAKLRKIGFLLDRAKADFETALDATLAGFNSVASESMRDVMEIQFLVRDFAAEPENLEEWLNADRELLYKKYRPVLLRSRYKKRLGGKKRIRVKTRTTLHTAKTYI
ncbi:hypothetical protein [Candidatus Binatus sp.]|jgi:hypothetical protein|uniref:hypothetical protein n=1 Tax=Candidatus Binatus sp. TaxID=2811406 RepID=UPI003BCB1A22